MTNNEFSLTPRDIARTVFRRRKDIVVVLVSALIVGFLVCALMPPVYQANSALLLDRIDIGPGKVSMLQEPMGVTNFRQFNQRDEINTEISLIRSRDVIIRAIEETGLTAAQLDHVADYRRYVRMTYKGTKNALRKVYSETKYLLHLSKRPTKEEIALRETETLILAVGQSLRVEQINDSDVIQIGFRCSDQGLAQKMSQSFCANAISWHLEVRRQSHDVDFFEKQVIETGVKLENVEKELAETRKDLNLIGADWRLNLLVEQRVVAKARLNEALAQKSSLAAGVESLRQLMENEPAEIVLSRDTRRSPTEEDVELGKQIGVNSLRQSLRQSMLAKSSDLSAATAKSQELESQLADYEKDLQTLNDQLYHLKVFERQRKTLDETYNHFLKSAEVARLNKDPQGTRLASLVMVQNAGIPLKPRRPRFWMYMSLALAGGLILGLGWAFVREAADSSYWNPSDLGADIRIPILGTLDRLS